MMIKKGFIRLFVILIVLMSLFFVGYVFGRHIPACNSDDDCNRVVDYCSEIGCQCIYGGCARYMYPVGSNECMEDLDCRFFSNVYETRCITDYDNYGSEQIAGCYDHVRINCLSGGWCPDGYTCSSSSFFCEPLQQRIVARSAPPALGVARVEREHISCEANNECPGNFCTFGRFCYECTENSDCYSYEFCRDSNICTLGLIGSCGVFSDCTSDRLSCNTGEVCAGDYYCKGGILSAECVLRTPHFGKCNNDYECISGYCNLKSKVCALKSDGASCEENRNCASGDCYNTGNGEKVCRSENSWIGECDISSACSDDRSQCIERGRLGPLDCADGYYCGNEISNNPSCLAKKTVGQECNKDFECLSEVCGGRICISKKTDGESCRRSIECESNNCDPVNDVCRSSSSWTGICGAPGIYSCPIDRTSCLSSEPGTNPNRACADDYYCSMEVTDLARIFCIPKKADGETCSSDYQCESENCYNEICGSSLTVPGTCTSSNDCVEGLVCYNNLCLISPGASCSADILCPQGQACSGGTCYFFALECDNNSDCGSGETCNFGVCGRNCDAGCLSNEVCLTDVSADANTPEICRLSCETTECPVGQGCVEDICLPIDFTPVSAECALDADCGTGEQCVNGECVAPTSCETTLDCSGNLVCVLDVGEGGECQPCNPGDADQDGLQDCGGIDPCIGSSEDVCFEDDLGISCNDLDGVVCGSNERCSSGSDFSSSSTELRCCVPLEGQDAGCEFANILLRSGLSVSFVKECLPNGKVQVSILDSNGELVRDFDALSELDITNNPYIDNTDNSCANVDLGDSAEEVPAYGILGFLITISLLILFYRNRKLLKY